MPRPNFFDHLIQLLSSEVTPLLRTRLLNVLYRALKVLKSRKRDIYERRAWMESQIGPMVLGPAFSMYMKTLTRTPTLYSTLTLTLTLTFALTLGTPNNRPTLTLTLHF